MIGGVILAAGSSTRLGRPKQLLEVGGRPLLQMVVDAASRDGLDEVVVVLGHEAERIGRALELPAGVRVVLNPSFAEGQSASLRAGLDGLTGASAAAVILLGDQPGVGPEVIAAAVREWGRRGKPLLRTFYSGTPGHPVVVARSHWDALRRTGGDRGARDAFATFGDDVTELRLDAPAPADVDTWEHYAALLAERGRSRSPGRGP